MTLARTLCTTICCALILATGAFALERPGLVWHQDLSSAWKVARDTRRPLLLYIKMQGCSYCQMMERDTFADATVEREIRQIFVPMAVEQSENPILTEKLGVEIFPTTVVIGLDGRVADSISGYASPTQLQQKLRTWQKLGVEPQLEPAR